MSAPWNRFYFWDSAGGDEHHFLEDNPLFYLSTDGAEGLLCLLC